MSLSVSHGGNIIKFEYLSHETMSNAAGETVAVFQNASAMLTVPDKQSGPASLDQIDLSPDAKKALAAILAGQLTNERLQIVMADAFKKSSNADSGIEVSSCTTTTNGPWETGTAFSTESSYDISWTDLEGRTSTLEIQDGGAVTEEASQPLLLSTNSTTTAPPTIVDTPSGNNTVAATASFPALETVWKPHRRGISRAMCL